MYSLFDTVMCSCDLDGHSDLFPVVRCAGPCYRTLKKIRYSFIFLATLQSLLEQFPGV